LHADHVRPGSGYLIFTIDQHNIKQSGQMTNKEATGQEKTARPVLWRDTGQAAEE
jgi:hypothetical protein